MLSFVRNRSSALLPLHTRGVAYSIVRVDVHDATAYGEYARIASQAVAEHGGGGRVGEVDGVRVCAAVRVRPRTVFV